MVRHSLETSNILESRDTPQNILSDSSETVFNHVSMENSFGHLNIVWGWITMLMGITSGSILSAWAFNGPFRAPKGHTRYDDLDRRLVRLAHIAFFMLPLINIVYGQCLDTLHIDPELKRLGSYSMIVFMIGIPSFLIMASFKLVFKYLNIIPITAGFIGLGIMAYGQWLLRMP